MSNNPSKIINLYKREVNKVQEQIDSIQEQYVNGLISELEKIDAILLILNQYELDTVKRYKDMVIFDNITGEKQDNYCKIRLLDNVRRALMLVQHINRNVNVYVSI